MFVPAWDKRTGQRHDVTEAWLAMDPNLTDVDPATVQDGVDNPDGEVTELTATEPPADTTPVGDKPARGARKGAETPTPQPIDETE